MTLALVLGVGLVTPAVADEEFTIGCVLPLSGVYGGQGQRIRDAYTFWADKVSDKGGISGKYRVRLVFRDDQSSPRTSAKLTGQLITQDKVDLLLGSYGSAQVMAASAVAELHKYPYLSGGAASDKLYERHYKYLFGTQGKATDQVRACVEVFTSVTPKPRTVAIVGSKIPSAELSCQGFKKYAAKCGFKIVHYELFPIRLKDYNTMLLMAKAKKPDLLLVGSRLDMALRVMKAMQEIDFNPRAVAFSHGPTAPVFIQRVKAKANYVFAASEWTPNLPYTGPVFGTARRFSQEYKQRFGRAPGYVEAASAAAGVALQKAVEQLGLKPGLMEAGRVKLMEQLHKIDLMTFYGPVSFGADGANRKHPPLAVQVQNLESVSYTHLTLPTN